MEMIGMVKPPWSISYCFAALAWNNHGVGFVVGVMHVGQTSPVPDTPFNRQPLSIASRAIATAQSTSFRSGRFPGDDCAPQLEQTSPPRNSLSTYKVR